MNEKKRPDIKVFFKAKGGDEYVNLAAFWKNDDGRYGGGVDRGITRIKIEFDDGSTKLIDLRDKKNPSHYCNVFAGPPPSRGQSQKREETKRPPDDGDDDIPFD